MLREQAKEMSANYWALERHLEKQKDTKGLDLMIEAIRSSSELMTSLVTRINEVIQFADELVEVAKEK